MGRDTELDWLHRSLQQSQRVSVSAVSGLGGVGKTELAVQYAQRHLHDYPGGVCWLKARQENIAAQVLQTAELELGLRVPQEWRGQRLTLTQQVQWCWQNWQPPGQTLVVLDDVLRLGNLRELLPTQPRFSVLLTTRQRAIDASFSELPLDVLADDAALELLTNVLGTQDPRIDRDRPAAAALCGWLGNLPLGLELVGRYLAQKRGLALTEMLDRLKAQSIADPAIDRDTNYQMTAERGVKAAFDLTWQTLDDDAQTIALLLSWFAPDIIPWELVQQMMQQVKGETYSICDATCQLDNAYLIQPTEENRYKIHPLIREFLRTTRRATPALEPLQQAFVDVLAAAARQMPETPVLADIAAFRVVHPHLAIVAQELSECLSDVDLVWAFDRLARFYEKQGLYSLAEPWYSQYLIITQARFGEEHTAVANSLNNLAVLYNNQGRYAEAEPLYEQALELNKRLLGEEHPDVANSLNNLAALYNNQGRYAEAESLHGRALELWKRLLGEGHPAVATSLNNLAALYKSQGRYAEAEPLLVQVLELRKRLLGEGHPAVATSLNNLAALYDNQGRYAEAEPLLVQALELWKQLLGEEHPAVATSLNNLAVLYNNQGRYAEAEPLYEQALELNKRLLGEEHPDVASSLNNLALLYKSQGRYAEAEPLLVQALELWKQLLGEEHPAMATSLNNLAYLYDSQGRYAEAEPLYEQALALRKRLLGEEHPDVANSLNNLAGLYRAQGRYAEAEPLHGQALALRQQLLGEEHPDVAGSLNNLALLYYSQGRYAEAELLYTQALVIFDRQLGSNHPTTVTVRQNLQALREQM